MTAAESDTVSGIGLGIAIGCGIAIAEGLHADMISEHGRRPTAIQT
jgi:hypothetical protein